MRGLVKRLFFQRELIFCVSLLLLLSGCATAPISPDLEMDWTSLRQLESWAMKGRLAFRQEKEGWHGKIRWVSDSKQDEIKISGPIGQGAIAITVRGDVAEIRRSDGRIEVVRGHESLLKKQLGVSVSLKALRWWVRGLPVDNEPFDMVKEDSGSVIFRQDGWRVSQRDFRLSGARVFPYRLKIENEKLSLKFVVDSWEAGS